MLDGEGLSYLGPTSTGLGGLEHSYQAFGNDGVSYNQRIDNTLVGRSQSAATIDALLEFSDHLPVVVDYQLPAVLDVVVETVPMTVELGSDVRLDVTVANAADVLVALGADELDYSVTSSGAALGDFSGTRLALAGGVTHEVLLDTFSVGEKAATITIATTSEGAENALWEVPIAYEVVSSMQLAGDINGDGIVDLVDLDILGQNFGLTPATREQGDLTGDGLVDLRDLDELGANFGATSGSQSVPEPSAVVLAATMAMAAGVRRRV